MTNIIYFVVGVVLSSWLVYNRFIRERTPQYLPESLSVYQVFLYLSLFGISTLVFISLLFHFFMKSESENKHETEIPMKQVTFVKSWLKTLMRLIRKISEKFGIFVKYSFRMVHVFFVSPIPNYISANLRLSQCLFYLEFGEQVLLLAMFVLIPQIVVCIGFAIDVFYVHQWNEFYNILICLGYPMIFNAYIGILNHLYDVNFDVIKSFFKETFDETTQEYTVTFQGTKSEFDQFNVNTLDEFLNKYYHGFRVMKLFVIEPFEALKADYGLFILLCTSLVYSSGWLYVILHGLQIINY